MGPPLSPPQPSAESAAVLHTVGSASDPFDTSARPVSIIQRSHDKRSSRTVRFYPIPTLRRPPLVVPFLKSSEAR
jgi:hypothetical protein